MERDGSVAFAAPDCRALKAKLQIGRGPETDLFEVDPWIAGRDHVCLTGTRIERIGNQGMPVKSADEELITEGAGDVRKTRDTERFHAIDAE